MKLTSKEGLKTIDTLTQDQRLHTKEFFNLWSKSSSLSNANIFLSFQTVQNIHKGIIYQAFLWVFPTKAPCHPRRVFFTEQERIQVTPKREKRRFHIIRVFAQWGRRWSTVSTSERHKKHLFANECPPPWSWSKVKTFPQEASQVKKATLGGALDLQILPLGN